MSVVEASNPAYFLPPQLPDGSTFTDCLQSMAGRRILVVGDIMADEYTWCDVSRVSPEAPVPVARVSNVNLLPGGAANVAHNIAKLGGRPYLVGFVGDDPTGEALLREFRRLRVPTSGIVRLSTRPTTTKIRVMARHQQMIRVDRESTDPISQEDRDRLMRIMQQEIGHADAIAVSDYAKGIVTPEFCQAVIALAKAHSKVIIIDPKGTDFAKYKGVTVLTPNSLEAALASSVPNVTSKNIDAVYRVIEDAVQADHILLKRGEEGMSLYSRHRLLGHFPAITANVYDVTGAGDTVVAVLALGLASGAEVTTSVQLANWAAGAVVREPGTAAVDAEQLKAFIARHSCSGAWAKVSELAELALRVRQLKKQGKRVGFTNGCFDLLHLGHITYLEAARSLVDVLIVGVNADASVRQLKGPGRPVQAQQERAALVAALEAVDYVTVFDGLTPDHVISDLKPHVHFKGGDYELEELPEAQLVSSYGGEVVLLEEVRGYSTTKIIDAILENGSKVNGSPRHSPRP